MDNATRKYLLGIINTIETEARNMAVSIGELNRDGVLEPEALECLAGLQQRARALRFLVTTA